ncbi:hypothetical protein BGZ60DRAFT_397328 [Tricladium varicosporioides]|nr:hypothetical protein BGZ60DRAFT_397328 [Hymenoscyphus varicosporioides]
MAPSPPRLRILSGQCASRLSPSNHSSPLFPLKAAEESFNSFLVHHARFPLCRSCVNRSSQDG